MPGKGEDDAKDDGAVDHAGGNVPRDGDDRQSGVPERVPVDEAARAESARPRVPNEARGQHVDHRAPNDLRQNADRRRQSVATGRIQASRGGATRRRHQPQLHGEEQDADERKPEARDAAGGQRDEASRTGRESGSDASRRAHPSTSATRTETVIAITARAQRHRHLAPGGLHRRALLPDRIAEVALQRR